MKAHIAITIDLLDESACREFCLRLLHPSGPRCPRCGVCLTGVRVETFRAGGRVECQSCGRWYTARTGTPLQGIKANWRQLVLLCAMHGRGCRPSDISPVCRISEDTVRRYLKRIAS